MKIKSLLAAVSIAALTAGAANALTIPVTPPASSMAPTPANAMFPEGAVLANELALPAEGIGSVTFTVATESGNYPAGNNFIVNVTLPTGVSIDGPVTGSVLSSLSLDDDDNVTTPSTIVPGGSAVVQSQSGTQLQLFVSIPQGGGEAINELNFSLPLELTNCDVSGSLTVTVATEGGTNVEDGIATAASPIAPCESAFNTSIVSDVESDGDEDTVIGLSDYEQLRDEAGNSLTNTSPIGLFTAEIDTDVLVSLGTAAPNGTAAGDPSTYNFTSGAPLTAASVDEVTFDVVFEDGSEIDSMSLAGATNTASTDGNTYSFTFPFTGDVSDEPIFVTVEGDDPIVSQGVVTADVAHDLTDAGGPDLIGSEDGTAAALDDLQREGQFFGVFDWNNGPAGGGTLSVYRVTGLPVGVEVPFTATVWNSGWGATNNTVTGSVTGDAAGEAVITSATIPALAGASFADVKRYDFGINFELGDPMDMDRLLLTNGTVTAMGDGSNANDFTLQNDPGRDGDNGRIFFSR